MMSTMAMQGRALYAGGQGRLGRASCARKLVAERPAPIPFRTRLAVYADDRDVGVPTDPYQLATARLQALLTDSRWGMYLGIDKVARQLEACSAGLGLQTLSTKTPTDKGLIWLLRYVMHVMLRCCPRLPAPASVTVRPQRTQLRTSGQPQVVICAERGLLWTMSLGYCLQRSFSSE